MIERQKIEGIILRSTGSGDFDRIITVFCAEGIKSIMAKNIRKMRSRRSFHIDLFNLVALEVETSFQGKRKYLREAQTINSFSKLKKHPEAFAAACLIAAFLLRTLPTDTPEPQIHQLTQKTLQALEKEPMEFRRILRIYFLKALRGLGYLPNTLSQKNVTARLRASLNQLDPQFTLDARRTLGIFSSLESTSSS